MPKITLENGTEINISQESYDEMANATKKILVPDSIKITESKIYFSHGIVNNEGQELYYDYDAEKWGVCTHNNINTIQCELVKCKENDLEEGDIHFDGSLDFIGDINFYYIYLGNGKQVGWDDGDVMLCDDLIDENQLYKVVPIK